MTLEYGKVEDESVEVDFTAEVVADIVTDAGDQPEDLHGLAHRLIAAYAGPLEIGGRCWNVIEAQGEEFLLTVPIPLAVLNDEAAFEDCEHDFLILQWYKRRSRMQQMLAIRDHDALDILAVCGAQNDDESLDIAARHNQAFWRAVLQALIDYYTTFPINTEPRLGDCCPRCAGHGKLPPEKKRGRPVKCIPCRGSGTLPTLQELCEALEAGNG